MKRYAIQLAYDGTPFSGWQRQKESRGIQEVVEEALERISGEPTPVIAAGRTDGGVHARGQVISFSLRKEWNPETLRKALDFHLESSVRAVRAAVVPFRFSARKDALWREYVYQIWDAPFIFPHVQGYAWWIRSSWNWEAVRQATEHLRGNHDFTAFCRAGDLPENPRRTISAVSLARRGLWCVFESEGNPFSRTWCASSWGVSPRWDEGGGIPTGSPIFSGVPPVLRPARRHLPEGCVSGGLDMNPLRGILL